MDTPQISRSGRVLKKSAKVKEMEDLDIQDFEVQGKPRKKSKGLDDYDEFDDKRVAPIKIPKISLNLTSPGRKKTMDMPHSMSKIASFPSPVKSKLDPNRPIFQESSPEASKDSDESSSASSETSSSSSSSSDDSEEEIHDVRQKFSHVEVKPSILQNITSQEKVIVEPYRQFDSPVTFVDNNTEISMDASEDETSESGLVIAEESNDSVNLMSKSQKGAASKKRVAKKDPSFLPNRGKVQRKKPAPKENKIQRKKKTEGRSKPLSAYMLWCSENRKRIAATMGNIGFTNLGKKMGEMWHALPDKEKMAWRRKAKRLALKNSSGLISTGPSNETTNKILNHSPSLSSDEAYKGLANGTAPIDAAAYLKLIGESLSVIGQRLTEHEGQLAVSGIFSVLLDSILCVVAPLLCLTSETPVLDISSQEIYKRTLDSIAYFMPGL